MTDASRSIDELRKLPISERIQLIEDLWESIAEDSPEEAFSITPELAAEQDRRLAEFEADPDSALPWEEVNERIRRLAGGRAS